MHLGPVSYNEENASHSPHLTDGPNEQSELEKDVGHKQSLLCQPQPHPQGIGCNIGTRDGKGGFNLSNRFISKIE